MEPKEKAKELVSKFIDHALEKYPNTYQFEHEKESAIICVNQIISNVQDCYNLLIPTTDKIGYNNIKDDYAFWLEVKNELFKLV